MPLYQGGEKNPNPNFLVRIFSGGVGVFHVNGWGPKSSIRPSKPGKSNFLGGISRDFAGISRGRPKSLRKKSLCSISVPYCRSLVAPSTRCQCSFVYPYPSVSDLAGGNSDHGPRKTRTKTRPQKTLCLPGKGETQTMV